MGEVWVHEGEPQMFYVQDLRHHDRPLTGQRMFDPSMGRVLEIKGTDMGAPTGMTSFVAVFVRNGTPYLTRYMKVSKTCKSSTWSSENC